MRKRVAGFTLLEVMVVTSIVAILAGLTAISFSAAGESSRDKQRQADLRLVEGAIEQYYAEHGRYPEGCNDPGVWSGEPGTDHTCPNDDPAYIIGLAPQYIPQLPRDPNRKGSDAGYVYATNAAGTVYKFKARNSVESESVGFGHPFASCDIREHRGTNNPDISGWCKLAASLDPFSACSEPDGIGQHTPSEEFAHSYAVWGGVAPLRTSGCSGGTDPKRLCEIQDTTAIICK